MLIKNNIIKYLKLALTSLNEKEVIFRYTQKINLDSHWTNLTSHNKQIFHISYPNNNTFIGFGECKKYAFKSGEDLKELKEISFSHQSYGCNKNIPPKLFGGVAFNINEKAKGVWENIPSILFYLPKLLIIKNKNEYYISFNSIINKYTDVDEINKEYLKYIQIIKDYKIIENDISFQKNIPNKIEYDKIFNSYIDTIKSKNISKAILSRVKVYKSKSEINLTSKLPYSTNFNFKLNKDNHFFGSTPELLIECKNKNYNTLALAGTLIKNNSEINDSLLNDIKELQEHNYVVENIVDTLTPFSSNITYEKKPEILELKDICHLSTPISGSLKKNIHILDLLFKLYPTPAVLGLPKKDALSLITKYEVINRGWYGGCIGWFDLEGGGRFDVSIRSALQNKDAVYFYAGGGILKESIADKEWLETESKFLQLLSAII